MDNYQKEANKYLQEARWTVWKTFTHIIIPIIGIGLLIGAFNFICNITSQPAKVVQKTLDADNIINNYEWFKQTYQDYKALGTQLTQARATFKSFKQDAGPREKWTFEDKTESARLRSVILGLENQIKTVAAEYNAKSAMTNRSLFKTNELPLQL